MNDTINNFTSEDFNIMKDINFNLTLSDINGNLDPINISVGNQEKILEIYNNNVDQIEMLEQIRSEIHLSEKMVKEILTGIENHDYGLYLTHEALITTTDGGEFYFFVDEGTGIIEAEPGNVWTPLVDDINMDKYYDLNTEDFLAKLKEFNKYKCLGIKVINDISDLAHFKNSTSHTETAHLIDLLIKSSVSYADKYKYLKMMKYVVDEINMSVRSRYVVITI